MHLMSVFLMACWMMADFGLIGALPFVGEIGVISGMLFTTLVFVPLLALESNKSSILNRTKQFLRELKQRKIDRTCAACQRGILSECGQHHCQYYGLASYMPKKKDDMAILMPTMAQAIGSYLVPEHIAKALTIPKPTEHEVKEETSEELRMKALIEGWKKK